MRLKRGILSLSILCYRSLSDLLNKTDANVLLLKELYDSKTKMPGQNGQITRGNGLSKSTIFLIY
jgi:hypothetical protein